ncbi:MAG TPA: hypothetical protein VFU46_03695 [Gemmatimonadales bacterium]|nr:hypothetical protein [Gemmatimonadales bacterium]
MRRSAGSPATVLALTLALALGAPACSSAPEPETGAAPETARTLVQVDNRNFYDMQIYAVRFGERQRLGLAIGNRTTTFELPPQWSQAGTVQFVASPVGSAGRAWSQELSVKPGDVIRLEITP